MKRLFGTGVALLALTAYGPTSVVAQEFESAHQEEDRVNEIDKYLVKDSGDGLDQVTSVTTFSDVQPTDWAYQALQNLVETYGCVAGYPDSSFRGNKSISRCLLYTSPSPRDATLSRMPSSA